MDTKLGLEHGGVPATQRILAWLCDDRLVLPKSPMRAVVKVSLVTLGHPETWSPVGRKLLFL